MKKTVSIAILFAVPFGLSACDKPAEPPKADARSDATGGMAMSAETKMGKGSGTVTAIDKAAGKITLDHGPIAELDWPAMKMGFVAKPDLLGSVAIGDKVAFEVAVKGSTSEVTAIKKQ